MFDLKAARSKGVQDQKIAEFLAEKHKFDLDAARAKGVSDTKIAEFLAARPIAKQSGLLDRALDTGKKIVSSMAKPFAEPQSVMTDYQGAAARDKGAPISVGAGPMREDAYLKAKDALTAAAPEVRERVAASKSALAPVAKGVIEQEEAAQMLPAGRPVDAVSPTPSPRATAERLVSSGMTDQEWRNAPISARDLLNDIASAVVNTPGSFAAGIANRIEGGDPFSERNWMDERIESDRARRKADGKAPDAEAQYPFFGLTRTRLRNMPEQFAFSLISMAEGLIGFAAGAATPIPGGAFVGGALASGNSAYAQSTNQFMRDVREALDAGSVKARGTPLSDEEFLKVASKYDELKTEYGLWEALPEAIGNTVGLAAGRLIFREAAQGLKGAVKSVGAALGTTATELGTETVTQIGQNNVSIDAGLSGGLRRSLTDPDDIRQSMYEVAPEVILLQGGMAGGAYAAGRAKGAWDNRSPESRFANWLDSTQPYQNGAPAQAPLAANAGGIDEPAEASGSGTPASPQAAPAQDEIGPPPPVPTDEEYRRIMGLPSRPAPDAPLPADLLEDASEAELLQQSILEAEQENAPSVPEPSQVAQEAPEARGPESAPEDTRPRFTHVPGNAGVAGTERGMEIPFQYALVEADTLRTSQLDDLSPNPDYPQELQPRDRTRAGSEMQIARMAADIKPRRLGEAPMVSEGAPVIGPDAVVESGNGRTIALRRAYAAGKANGYYDWLEQNADYFGFDPMLVARMRAPMLVRVRTAPVDRLEFVRQANESALLVMSPVEQARADAARIDSMDDLAPTEDGDFASSRGFIRRFVGRLPATEQAGLITAEGRLSQAGYARVRNAILARAYGDSPVLTRLVESIDDNLRNIGKALVTVAPAVAKVRADMADGALFDVDLTPDLIAAVETLSRLKDEGRAIAEELAQMGMLDDGLSAEARELLAFLADNVRRPRKIAEFILRYTEALRAAGNPNQGSLLGETQAPTKAELLAAARGRTNETATEQQSAAAEQPAAPEPERSRPAEPGAEDRVEPAAEGRDRGRAQGNEGRRRSVTPQPATAPNETPADAGVSASEGASQIGALSYAEMPRQASTFDEARALAKAFQGRPLRNRGSGISATVSRNNLDKMLSASAVGKSTSAADQSLAVANLDHLFANAQYGWAKQDRDGDPNIAGIHRLFAAMDTATGTRVVKLTVKESARTDQGSKIYTVEALEIDSPASIWVDSTVRGDGLDPTSTPYAGRVQSLIEAVRARNASELLNPKNGKPFSSITVANQVRKKQADPDAWGVYRRGDAFVLRRWDADSGREADPNWYDQKRAQEEAAKRAEAAPAEPLLQAYTAAEIAEQEAAQREREATEARAEQEAAERDRKAREQAEVRARSEAAADTFELGMDPMENLTGQGGLFGQAEPAPAARTAPTEPAAPGRVAPEGEAATVERIEGDKLVSDAPEVEYVTKKGKTLRGVIARGLTRDEALQVDAYTFKMDGGYFVRLAHVTRPAAMSRAARSAPRPSGPAMTRADVLDAVTAQLPGLARSVESALRRGDEGKAGGVVVVERAEDLAGMFASKTGRTMEEARNALQMSRAQSVYMTLADAEDAGGFEAMAESAFEAIASGENVGGVLSAARDLGYSTDSKSRLYLTLVERARSAGIDLNVNSSSLNQNERASVEAVSRDGSDRDASGGNNGGVEAPLSARINSNAPSVRMGGQDDLRPRSPEARLSADADNMTVAPYHRFTNSGPDTGVGYMMFADSALKVAHYGRNHYTFNPADVSPDSVIHAADARFRSAVVRALENNPDKLDEYGGSSENLADELNPDDIVDTAMIWDSPDLVEIIWNEVLEPNGWIAVKTYDGAIIFDVSAVRKAPIDIRYSQNGDIQGFYDPRSGLTFLVGSALTAETAPAVLLHEATHAKQRADIDARALALIDSRDKAAFKRVREFLDRVAQRMEDAGEAGNAPEAAAYVVEQAVTEGRQAGFSAVDGKLMNWIDAKMGKRVGDIVRDFVAMVRAWAQRAGVKLNPSVDDLVALAKMNVRAMARGEVMRIGDAVSGSRASPQSTLPPQPAGPVPQQQQGMPLGGGARGTNWDAPAMSRLDNFIQTIQDKFIDLKRVQQAINETGNAVPERFDAYLAEELYHGRVATRTKRFLNDEVKPLLREMQEKGVTREALETYLHARHAPEANAAMAEANPNQQEIDVGRMQADAQVRTLEAQLQQATTAGRSTRALEDALRQAREERLRWNGIQAFRGTEAERLSLSGMSDADAAAHMASLTPGQQADMAALAARIDAINARTLRETERYGLMDAATLDAWRNKYQFYVPLHRDEAHADSVNHPIGQGYSNKGDTARRRTGSNERVTNILGHVLMQREAVLTRGEKNMVGLTLYGLALQNPNPDFWAVDRAPRRRTIDPDTGFVIETTDPTYKNKPNVFVVRVRGEDRAIVFNERNARAVRMAAALKNLDVADMGAFFNGFAKVTRYFASINTQYNPIFGIVNVVRDVQGAMINLASTPIDGKQAEIAANVLPALRAIWNVEREGTKGKQQWRDLWAEMQEVGGITGYRELFRDADDRTNDLEREMKKLERGNAGKYAHAVLDWLTDYNVALENAVRLAAYKAALDAGQSKKAAASLAKNLTVNFNRKGRIGREVGALFAFFNASVQGTARLVETMRTGAKPGAPLGKKGMKIIAGGLGLGMLQAVMGALFFDEDDWDKIPEFVKRTNTIIPIGAGRYVTIPMPLGLNAIPNFGRVLTELALDGGKDAGKRTVDLLAFTLSAFDPLGGSATPLQYLSPTALDPIAALSENLDWRGQEIARKNLSPTDPEPGHRLAKDGASEVSRWLAWGFNRVTFGTDYRPGGFSPTPDQIDYVFGQIFGGVGREALKLTGTVGSTVKDEDLPAYRIPLAGRFYGNTADAKGNANRYYANRTLINELENEIKGRAKDGKDVGAFMRDNPLVSQVGMANGVDRAISGLRRARREIDTLPGLTDRQRYEQKREIDIQIGRLMDQFNQSVKQVERGGQKTLREWVRERATQ